MDDVEMKKKLLDKLMTEMDDYQVDKGKTKFAPAKGQAPAPADKPTLGDAARKKYGGNIGSKEKDMYLNKDRQKVLDQVGAKRKKTEKDPKLNWASFSSGKSRG